MTGKIPLDRHIMICQQPWEFYVVTDKNVIAQLSEASPYAHCAKEAPVVFVSCYRSEGLHAFALVPCGYPAEERPQENRYDVSRVHYIA